MIHWRRLLVQILLVVQATATKQNEEALKKAAAVNTAQQKPTPIAMQRVRLPSLLMLELD